MAAISFEQAEEYATFCIMCDRNGYQPMKAEDYFNMFKDKENG